MGIVEHEALKMSATYGIFAVLFVALLFYVLRENSRREASYQKIINNLSDKLGVVDEIQKDVREIKNKVYD